MIRVEKGKLIISLEVKPVEEAKFDKFLKDDVILSFVKEKISQAIAEIPIPKDGENGLDGKSVTLPDVMPEILEAVNSEVKKIPRPSNGKDGIKGKDGKSIKGDKGEKGDTGEGVPEGGIEGEVLTKLSSKDFDTAWRKPKQGQSEGAGSLRLVKTVTGLNTDNSDRYNPIVRISVDGVSITGAGTPASPLVAVGGATELMGNLFIKTPANETIYLIPYSLYAFDIEGLFNLSVSSGSLTLAVKINGTNVTGLSGLSVTSTPQNPTASGANSVSIGDEVSVVISGVSSPANLKFTMEGTR